MNLLHELSAAGQSPWLDFVRRTLITSGELQRLLDDGITGVTSNPSIFGKAIGGSTDYDEDGPQDFRCMECDCKPGSMTSRYPCGANVPRETITVGE